MIQIVGRRKRSTFRTSFLSASDFCDVSSDVSSIIAVPIFSVSSWDAIVPEVFGLTWCCWLDEEAIV